MSQKVVLVTGTSSGIGLGTALALAKRGAWVFASMRDVSKASRLLDIAASDSGRIDVIQLDVTDSVSVDLAVQHVVERAGRIDVVVNNAAVTRIGPLEFTTDEDARWMFDTNVFGPLRVTRAVLGHMRAAGSGRIVNVSSTAAHARVGVRLFGLYAMSKSALHTMTLELAKEVTPLGIEVVLLEGGVAGATDIWAGVAETVAGFDTADPPYRVAEAICAAMVRFISANPSDPSITAGIVAQACLVDRPALRFPPDAQLGINSANQISDDRFLSLAKGESNPELYEGVAGFWPMQRGVLAELATGIAVDGS